MRVEFQYDLKRREVKIVSDYFSNIREHFSVKNPGARFNRFQRFIPQRIYAITPAGYCDVGLVPEIESYLKTLNIPFEIVYSLEYVNLLANLPYKAGLHKELDCSLKLRPYQREAVSAALEKGHGTIVVGTGGGKTFIMATLLSNIDFKMGKVLIIVPDIGLVAQTYNDFISYGIPEHMITKWTGSHEVDLSRNVVIANLGILQSDNSDISWFNQVTCLFVDECHKLRNGNKVNKLVDKIPTFNRFGFTGTLPEDPIDTWNIIGRLGPVIYEKTTSNLRDEGEGQYIANAQAIALELEYNFKPDYTAVSASQRYLFELDFIHNSAFRYNVIKRLVGNLKNNCLILVDHIAHGDRMYKELQTLEGKEVYFIQGSVEVEDRRKIQQLMEKQDNVVCVAISKIFSTGISIKNIHYIMFAAGGKSKIKTLQSIGRGLRIHENKEILTIIDLVDNLVYGKKHFDKRKQFYDLEKIQIKHKTITES
jgi:superfamily II DNA or RNA helicase